MTVLSRFSISQHKHGQSLALNEFDHFQVYIKYFKWKTNVNCF